MENTPTRIQQMKLVQALRKLAKNTLWGYDLTTTAFIDLLNPAIFESSGRWISERVGFNARRVLLVEFPITQRVVRVGDDDLEHILYSEQRNIVKGSLFLYDYTLLDKTHEAATVVVTTTATASGIGGTVTETLSSTFPIHMVRYARASSDESDHVDFSKLYAFAPGNITVTEDMELDISGVRHSITEVVSELLCTRISVVERGA